MKSTEVYRVLRTHFGAWCKAAGFRRTKGGMLGWYKPHEGQQLVLWFQCSQHGWDPHTGSQFTLEFQLADRPEIGVGFRNRSRFYEFLTAEELEEVRAYQNAVIAALTSPPEGHWSELDGRVREWYLGQFEPVEEPYTVNQDVWLRYGRESDVVRWAEFLLPRVPRMLVEFEMQNGDRPSPGS